MLPCVFYRHSLYVVTRPSCLSCMPGDLAQTKFGPKFNDTTSQLLPIYYESFIATATALTLYTTKAVIAPHEYMKLILIRWPLMGGLLHLVQLGGDWAGPHPAQAPPGCTKCNSPPINGQCANQITVLLCNGPLLCGFNVPVKR